MKKIMKLLLIIAWMGVIFLFSNDPGDESLKKSDGEIIRTVEFLSHKKLTEEEKEKWIQYLVVPVRKGAHFFVYFVLGILIISFLKEFKTLSYKLVLLAVFLSFLYACSDEIHQLFVPGRSGQFRDVLIDTTGALTGILGYKVLHNRFRKRSL